LTPDVQRSRGQKCSARAAKSVAQSLGKRAIVVFDLQFSLEKC
jgi:hypothetical protein